MAEINRTSLFGKLNSLAYKSVESATVFCKMRGNPYVELIHFLHMVLQQQDSDLHHIINHYELNPSRLSSDMTASLDSLPRGQLPFPIFLLIWRRRWKGPGYTVHYSLASHRCAPAI